MQRKILIVFHITDCPNQIAKLEIIFKIQQFHCNEHIRHKMHGFATT